jgi:uncharacterized protein (DUF1499 family)
VTKHGRLPLISIGLVSAYLLSIASIQIAAPDQVMEPDDFPIKCSDDSLNCSMIGPNSHRSGNLTELRFNSSLEVVMDEILIWISVQPGTSVIGEWPNQSHSVFRTLMFRFPDDFVVTGFCEDSETVIHVFSKSRLGISDLGVNKARVQSFAEYMSSVEMATSDCV